MPRLPGPSQELVPRSREARRVAAPQVALHDLGGRRTDSALRVSLLKGPAAMHHLRS